MNALFFFVAQTVPPASGVTIEHVLVAGITAVAGALVYVYKESKTAERRCDEDRKKLWEVIEQIRTQTCPHSDCSLQRQLSFTGAPPGALKAT